MGLIIFDDEALNKQTKTKMYDYMDQISVLCNPDKIQKMTTPQLEKSFKEIEKISQIALGKINP